MVASDPMPVALGLGRRVHDRRTFGAHLKSRRTARAYPIPLGCLRSFAIPADCSQPAALPMEIERAGASLRVMGRPSQTGQASRGRGRLLANDGTVEVQKVQSALRNQGAVPILATSASGVVGAR